MDGQYVHVEELVSELKKLGHDISIVGPKATTTAAFGSESGTLRNLRENLPKSIYELLELSYCLLVFSKLVIRIWQFRPEIIYERYNLFTPSGIWAKKLFDLPLISEVNAPLFEERSSFGGLGLKKVAKWSQGYVWRNADCVITVTEVLKGIILKYGVNSENVEVMPNGVDLSKFKYTEEQRHSIRTTLGIDDNFVLGFTGFVREWHKLEYVLKLLLLPAFENAVLVVVGDGPAVANLKALARKTGVSDRFFVTGVVPRSAVSQYVSAFDIAIQASVVQYASPLKIIEYLALGRAIAAPKTANIAEILSDGENAVLFTQDSANELQRALESIKHNPQYMQDLQLAARDTIEKLGLTWSRNAFRVMTVANRLTSKRRH